MISGGSRGSSLSTDVVSTNSVVSTSSLVSGALVATALNIVAGTVDSSVEVVAASKTSTSDGTSASVVGAVPIVWTGTVFEGTSDGTEVVVLATAFGGRSVLSVPCESPPVVSNMTTIASTITVAAPATQIIERESFHQLPVGSS